MIVIEITRFDPDGEEIEMTHQAIYDFIPTKEGQVMLKHGDPLYITNSKNEEYYEGKNLRSGKEGLILKKAVATIVMGL